MSVKIFQAETDTEIGSVRTLFLEYLGYIEVNLGETLEFQHTEQELNALGKTYETLWLATLNGEVAGACGVKTLKPGICELKRLYTRPNFQGHGLGRSLITRSLKWARAAGYKEMYLDTNPDLIAANKLYESLGFRDIEKYYDNPLVCSRYMALTL